MYQTLKRVTIIGLICSLLFPIIIASIIGALLVSNSSNITIDEEMLEGLPPILTEEMIIGAIESQSKYEVPASVTLAQIVQESSGSNPGHLSGLAYECKNLFGMKGEGPAGSKEYATGEYGGEIVIYAKFRKYNNFKESIDDHGKLLCNSRYKKYTSKAKTSDDFAKAIHKAGYATDPNYSDTLIRLMIKYDLYKFDEMSTDEAKDYINGDGKHSGKFRWPLNVAGYISSPFGNRPQPIPGASTYHQGVDIAVSAGTDILAADGGTVSHAGWYGTGGNTVIIKHKDGLETHYYHMLSGSIKVKKGQKVSKGQHIGDVGSTGNSSGNHLHFGIKLNGKFVDPLKYVSQKK